MGRVCDRRKLPNQQKLYFRFLAVSFKMLKLVLLMTSVSFLYTKSVNKLINKINIKDSACSDKHEHGPCWQKLIASH